MILAAVIGFAVVREVTANMRAPECPEGWLPQPGSDSCYFFSKSRYSWDQARTYCEGRSAKLVSIRSAEEKTFISRLANSGPMLADAYSIGLHAAGSWWSRKWLWQDGTEWTLGTSSSFIDWDAGQPSILSGDCVSLFTSTGRMRALDCASGNQFICRKSVVDLPQCPDDWVEVNSKCHKMLSYTASWNDALSACESQGGTLPTIEKFVELQHIWDVLNQNSMMDNVWLGAKVTKASGLRWPQPNVTTIGASWALGEPKLTNASLQYCVMLSKLDARWHAVSCSVSSGISCTMKSQCFYGWNAYDGNCYQFNTDFASHVSWPEARKICENQNSSLVEPLSAVENEYLVDGIWSDVWIGITDNAAINPRHDGKFVWASSGLSAQDSGFSNFYLNQTTKTPGRADCGYIDNSLGNDERGQWRTTPCDNANYFICKAPEGQKVVPLVQYFDANVCPSGWSKFGHSCYRLSTEKKTWLQARDACRAIDSNLVSFTSEEEVAYLNGNLREPYWIGLNDRDSKGTWVWDNSPTPEPLGKFSYWAFLEPVSSTDKNCAYTKVSQNFFTGSISGKWAAESCASTFAYVCGQTAGPSSEAGDARNHTTPAWFSECGPYWALEPVSGSCFRASEEAHSWNDAAEACQRLGSNLASIHSPTESIALLGYLRQYFSGSARAWIGVSNAEGNNNWQWNDRSGFNYINWASGQPDSGSPGNAKECGEIYADSGSWSTASCRSRRPYICRKSSSAKTTTAAPSTTTPSLRTGQVWGCSAGWREFSGFCYNNSGDLKLDRANALRECRRAGADLASLHSDIESSFLSSYLSGSTASTSAGSGFWIGLNDLGSPGYFTWSDGSSAESYTKWSSSGDSGLTRQGTCVLFNAKGNWETADCERQLPYVCRMAKSLQETGVTDPAETGCPSGWESYGYSCYLFADDNNMKTYYSASQFCQTVPGGNLVDIWNRLENSFLTYKLAQRSGDYYIGLREGYYYNTYVWSTTAKVAYTNWDENGMNSRNGSCVVISAGITSGLWSTARCYDNRKFICKTLRNGFTMPFTGTTTEPPQFRCASSDWKRYNGQCYKAFTWGYYNLARTWSESRQGCLALGADLVSIHSQEENDFVVNVTASIYATQHLFWIGLNSLEGSQGWSDGTSTAFTHYAAQDAASRHENEKCFLFDPSSSGAWSFANCFIPKNYICKMPVGNPLLTTPVPTYPPPSPKCFNSDSKWRYFEDENACYTTRGYYSKTWHQARQYCQSLGANTDLASVHSISELNFIITLVGNSYAGDVDEAAWIGLTELAEFGAQENYVWSDRTPLDMLPYWALGEPNDGGFSQTESCVAMRKADGKWSDEHCGALLGAVCKHHLTPPATVSPPPPITGNCPEGWIRIENKCIRFIGEGAGEQKLNWSDALSACKNATDRTRHPNLLSISNAAVRLELVEALFDHRNRYWIGLTDQDSKRRYRWTDNSEVVYLPWAYGKPSSPYYLQEMYCVEVQGSGKGVGKMADTLCATKQEYICEQDPSPLESPQTVPEKSCANNFTAKLNSCYKLTSQRLTWTEAEAECESYGANTFLASVTSVYEQALIDAWMKHLSLDFLWIGIRHDKEGDHWADGWPSLFTNWAYYEPSLRRGDTEVCGYVRRDDDGVWLTTSCNLTKSVGICKYSLESKPTVLPPQTVSEFYSCPKGSDKIKWLDAGGYYCYALFQRTELAQPQAAASCFQFDSQLASIHDSRENEWIKEHLRTQVVNNLWIGLVPKFGSGGFKWLDESAVDFEFWADSQETVQPLPDVDNCVSMTSSGNWTLENCTQAQPYLCRRRKILNEPVWNPPVCFGDEAWRYRNGKCYFVSKLITDSQSFQGCQRLCNAKQPGGALASIHSLGDNKFLQDLIDQNGYGFNDVYWIGLSSVILENDEMRWTDEASLNFEYWADSASSASGFSTDGRCVELDRYSGKWKRQHCGVKQNCLCEARNDTSSPELKLTAEPIRIVRGGCGSGWTSFPESKRCYKFVVDEQRLSWQGARDYCRNRVAGKYGDLVSIHSSLEQDFIITQLSEFKENFWIGLNDLVKPSHAFVWSDQSDFYWSHWDAGEPNGRWWEPGNEEGCVEMYGEKSRPAKWNDVACDKQLSFVCAVDKDPDLDLASPFVNATYCPEGYFYFAYTNACYKLLASSFGSWSEGEQNCQKDASGAHLASISSVFEEAMLRIVMNWNQISDAVWIGLDKDGNQLRWIDNLPVRYTHWSPFSQVERSSDHSCVRLLPNGTWHDVNCNAVYAPLCKYTTDNYTVEPMAYAGTCPDTTSNGAHWQDSGYTSCFLVAAEASASAAEAMVACKKAGGALASLHSQDEVDFLKQTTSHYNAHLWIGLLKTESGAFEWLDNSAFDFESWAKTTKPQVDDASDDCVEFVQGEWQPADCSNREGYVCRAEKIPLTTPLSDDLLSTTNPFASNADDAHGVGFAHTIKATVLTFGSTGVLGVMLALVCLVLLAALVCTILRTQRRAAAGFQNASRRESTQSHDSAANRMISMIEVAE